MPEPNEGIDYYIYKHIVNPLAMKLCFLSPNFVTTMGILLTTVFAHNSFILAVYTEQYF